MRPGQHDGRPVLMYNHQPDPVEMLCAHDSNTCTQKEDCQTIDILVNKTTGVQVKSCVFNPLGGATQLSCITMECA